MAYEYITILGCAQRTCHLDVWLVLFIGYLQGHIQMSLAQNGIVLAPSVWLFSVAEEGMLPWVHSVYVSGVCVVSSGVSFSTNLTCKSMGA